MNDSSLSSYTVGLTLRSLKIAYDVPPNRKKAITLEQLRKLADYCQLRGLLGFTLKLAILVAFFGLLRLSNLVPPTVAKFDPTRHSTHADLKLEEPGLQFAQRWAKNRQTQLPQQEVPRIPIPQLEDDPLDPVQAMIDLYNLTATTSPNDPMLLVPTAAGGYYVLDQRRFREEFHRALIACDLDSHLYTPHSFRRGGATLLHQTGATMDDIKRQGLWRSEAVKKYIQDQTLTQSSVLDTFANAVNHGASTSASRPPSPETPPRTHWFHSPHGRIKRPSPRPYKKGPTRKTSTFVSSHLVMTSNCI